MLRYLVLRNSASSTPIPRLNSYGASYLAIATGVVVSLVGSAPNALRYQINDGGLQPVPPICIRNGSHFANLYSPDQKVRAYTLIQPEFWTCSWERVSFWTAGLLLKMVPCV